MHILELPQEVFEEILYYAIVARNHPFGMGKARGMRLKLVCKTFRDNVNHAMFRTGYIQTGRSSPFMRSKITKHKWRTHSSKSPDTTWHAYLVHRCRTVTGPGDDTDLNGHFFELRETAATFSRETGADFQETLDALCWAAVEGGAPFDPNGKEPWRYVSEGGRKCDDDFDLELNLLSAAAHLNHRPLARRLLKEGHDPTFSNNLFSTPMLLAAFAGHREMLLALQYNLPEFEKVEFPKNLRGAEALRWRNGWKGKADPSAILGAYLRGDVDMLRLAMFPPSRANPDDPTFFGQALGEIRPNGHGQQSDTPADSLYMIRKSYLPGSWAAFDFLDGILAEPPSKEDLFLLMHYACTRGDAEIVRNFIDEGRAPVMLPRSYDQSSHYQPLITATRHGHEDIIDLLISRGASLKECPQTADSGPLIVMAVNGTSTRIARKLFENDAPMDVLRGAMSEVWPWTLSNAVTMEHTAMVELVLDHEWVDKKEQFRALSTAMHGGYESMVELLWRKGVRLNGRDVASTDPAYGREYRVANEMMKIIERLDQEEEAQTQVEKRAMVIRSAPRDETVPSSER